MFAGALLPGLAPGQSLTAGSLTLAVRDSSGAPLGEVYVLATSGATGIGRTAVTDRNGRATLDLLASGAYTLRVERLGFRPLIMTGARVHAGRTTAVDAALVPAPRPVVAADTVALGPTPTLDTETGAVTTFGALELADLPDPSRAVEAALRFTALAAPSPEVQGLASPSLSVLADGVPFLAARHPMGLLAARMAPFPLLEVSTADLVTGGVDVEWTGAAAGILNVGTRRGTQRLQGHVFGDYTGSSLSSSRYYATDAVANSSVRAGALVSGPLLADSAAFLIGAEVQRLETPRPAAWEDRALDSALVTVARDSFGTDLAPYATPGMRQTTAQTVFGSFDWQINPNHGLGFRGTFTSAAADDPDLGPGFAPSLGARLESRDVTVAATATSALGARLAQEVRFGIDVSRREWLAGPLPVTTFSDGGFAVGTDPALPAEFKRANVHGSITEYIARGSHRLKAGLAVNYASHDQTFAFDRRGAFTFSGPTEFAMLTGTFSQRVGRLPTASFSTLELGLYLQDTWSVGPGLDLLAGLRYELEQLPADAVRRNQAWLDSTGVDNTSYERSSRRFSPRLGLTWDVRNRHLWIVRAYGGVYHDRYDPGLFGELITNDGTALVRTAVGGLGRWPTAPDSLVAPVGGTTLTLFGPRFATPRTRRASFGISRALGGRASVHVAVNYRHTDFLPRRRDLNRLPAPTGVDQYGRPLYGALIQQGGLLTAAPGSNRAFRGFDLVSTINADGYSDYVDVSLALERRVGALQLAAAYVYSGTRDNWLTGRTAGRGPLVTLDPFPDSLGGQDWSKGTSDFDLPHRAVLAAEWQVPGRLGIRLAGFYRYESGYPFTPGFAPGVDANGDGANGNDPAYVDDAVPGADSLLDAWKCLASQIGRFVERNSCRSPGTHALDLRFTMRLPFSRGPLVIVVDALNLIEADAGLRDPALYRVDASAALTTDPATGITTVPLAANPGFGRVLARQSTGRALRVGLRFSY